MTSFSNFREGLNFLRRRFSSNDLPNDSGEEPSTNIQSNATQSIATQSNATQSSTQSVTPSTTQSVTTSPSTHSTVKSPTTPAHVPSSLTNTSSSTAGSNSTPTTASIIVTSSASTSSFFPSSSKGPFPSAPSSPSKATRSNTSDGYSFARNLFGRSSQKGSKKQAIQIDPYRNKNLLIIDNSDVAWETYFKGKKVGGIYDVRVTQAGFSSINVISSTEDRATVEISQTNEPFKSIKPDFLLVRQKVKDAQEDWSHVIVGLKHGGIPSLNNLNSVYNLADKSWTLAQLSEIRRRLGREYFPFVSGTYFSSNKNVTHPYDYPLVTRTGHAHGGMGLTKIENSSQFRDWTDLLQLNQSACSIQPYVEVKCDVRIQKIGSHYRAFSRTPITNHWKISPGQIMLEEISVTERYKNWLEECSSIFDVADMLSLQLLIDGDDQEYIIGVNDCTMDLIGESQEEDRKLICELIVDKMDEALFRQNPPLKDSKSQDLSTSRDQVEDSEDTMRNLRKTFAGIFGDM